MWHPVSLLNDWPSDIQHASMVTLGSVIAASLQLAERWQPTATQEGSLDCLHSDKYLSVLLLQLSINQPYKILYKYCPC